jgi:hypothetical protein
VEFTVIECTALFMDAIRTPVLLQSRHSANAGSSGHAVGHRHRAVIGVQRVTAVADIVAQLAFRDLQSDHQIMHRAAQ